MFVIEKTIATTTVTATSAPEKMTGVELCGTDPGGTLAFSGVRLSQSCLHVRSNVRQLGGEARAWEYERGIDQKAQCRPADGCTPLPGPQESMMCAGIRDTRALVLGIE